VEAISDDDRQKRPEAIQDGYDSDLNATMNPAFHILRRLSDVGLPIMARTFRVGICLRPSSSLTHDLLLFLVEKVCSLKALWYKPYAADSIQDGNDAFENIEPVMSISFTCRGFDSVNNSPTPSSPASDAIHV
jgi:hypothetical protein